MKPVRQFRVFCGLILLSGLGNAAGLPGGELHRPKAPVVAPVDELEILDPRVDPEGKPRTVMELDANGRPQVAIPPSIIVHKYYYTGDRDFQAPPLPGGPAIVVVNHPVTGERTYVEVALLPGSPRIYYTDDAIDYEYEDRCIRIHFGHGVLGHACKPRIVIHKRSRLVKHSKSSAKHVYEGTREFIERTGVPHAASHVGNGMRDAAHSTADRIHDVGEIVVAPAVRVWEATPLQSLFTSDPSERASHLRDAKVGNRTLESFGESESLRTLR
jgi:hypothetical protein